FGGPAAAQRPPFDRATFALRADGFQGDAPGAVDDLLAHLRLEDSLLAREEDLEGAVRAGGLGEERDLLRRGGARPADPADERAVHEGLGPLVPGPSVAVQRLDDVLGLRRILGFERRRRRRRGPGRMAMAIRRRRA